MAAGNDHVSVPTCDAITRGLEGRIDAVDERVTALGADMGRRIESTNAWVKDLSADQKKFFWLLVSTLATAVGTMAMVIFQMATRGG